MSRWVWFWVSAILGLVMLICGWLVPTHLRAVDVRVIQKAGRRTPALIERGLGLTREKRLGAAELLLRAAQTEGFADQQKLALAVTNLAKEHPGLQLWGGGERHLEILFGGDAEGSSAEKRAVPGASRSEPLTEFMIRPENRDRVLGLLRAAPRPFAQELLRCRALTKTAIFPPSQSASGQALDAVLSECGLLAEEGHLKAGLSNAILGLAFEANHGGNSQPLEQALLDLMSLGQRLNWGQLAAFVEPIEDAETLRLLANLVRKPDGQLPLLFSAVQLSGKPAEVARYLMNFSRTGMKDMAASLRFGEGGVSELLRRNQRLYSSNYRQQVAGQALFSGFFSFALDYSWQNPRFALMMKWLLYLAGGFLIAVALHFARPAVPVLERPLQVRGFHVAREILFALGFLVVVLLLSEPFLSQENQKVDFPFRLRLPTVGSAVPAAISGVKGSFMNQYSLLTLLLFFVLQALIYLACLVKLAEIRRQRVPSRLKLRLLENEEHLFDAGLYLGFAGTIISLILVSLGVIQQSLMAAYSSTSFGIIFVSVFKIFHLRPARRTLLLEAEGAPPEPVAPTAVRTYATPS